MQKIHWTDWKIDRSIDVGTNIPTTSFNICDEKLDNFRKQDESKGLPKYISYFQYRNCKGRLRNPRHGYNVYHSKLGKRKTITIPLGDSLDEIKKSH